MATARTTSASRVLHRQIRRTYRRVVVAHRNNDPHKKLELLEGWSGRATLLILFGITVEIVALLWFPHNPWERFWGIIANALIGVGLAAEYVIIGQTIVASAEAQTKSDAKLAEALDRATRAETALMQFRKPRRSLLEPHIEQLSEELTEFAGTKFDVGFGSGDGEQADFCWDIEELLAGAGWDQQHWTGSSEWINDRGRFHPLAGAVSAANVEIHFAQDLLALRPAARAFASALKRIGIEAKGVHVRAASDVIHILIGPKT